MLKKLFLCILLLFLLLVLGRALFLDSGTQNHTGEGETQLKFSAYDLKSKRRITIKDWQGSWVLLHFWASWCDNCELEFPLLQKYHTHLPILGVRYKDKSSLVLGSHFFAADLLDPDGRLGLELGVMATPESFLINPQGKIAYRYQGPLTEEIMQHEILTRIKV